MDENERLEQLQERRNAFEQSIKNIDADVRQAEDALIRGEEPAKLVAYLRERQETQRGFIYDLAQTEARIDDLQARISEREHGSRDSDTAERLEAAHPAPSAQPEWYQKRNNEPAQAQLKEPAERSGQGQREWFITRDRPETADVNEDRERNRTR